MSGLIWAGIGRGIADAGSTFGNAMMRGIEEERRTAAEMAREERLIARDEEREQRKEERLEAAAKKDADIFAEAEKAAPGIGQQRRFEQFKKDVGQTDMSEEELRGVFESQYDQRRVGQFEGADRYLERYSKQKEDVLNEIRRRGGSSGLINQATNVYKSTLEAERAADRLAFEEKREESRNAQNERRLDLMEERITSQNKTDAVRAARPTGSSGGAGGVKVRSTKTDADGNVIAIMSDGTTKPLGIKSGDYNKSVANLIAQREKNDYQFKNLPEEEKKAWATGRLTPSTPTQRSSDNAGSRPPLSSFNR